MMCDQTTAPAPDAVASAAVQPRSCAARVDAFAEAEAEDEGSDARRK